MATNANAAVVLEPIQELLQSIRQRAQMSGADIADVFGIQRETVSRWNQGKTQPHRETAKLLTELGYITEKLSDLYSPSRAKMWLTTRQKLLDDRRPIELIAEGEVEEVLAIINRMLDGAYL